MRNSANFALTDTVYKSRSIAQGRIPGENLPTCGWPTNGESGWLGGGGWERLA
jgi:hypothetical protein